MTSQTPEITARGRNRGVLPRCSCCSRQIRLPGHDRCTDCRRGSCDACGRKGRGRPRTPPGANEYRLSGNVTEEWLDELARRAKAGLPLFPQRRRRDDRVGEQRRPGAPAGEETSEAEGGPAQRE